MANGYTMGQYARDPLAWLSALGTMAGVYNIYRQHQAATEYARRSRDWTRRMEEMARAPINVEAFYKPMSDAEHAAMIRAVGAQLGPRGVFEGGYASSIAAETGAARESARWQTALEAALRNREAALRGLGQAAPVAPLGVQAGDTGALGSYLRWRTEQTERERARKMWEAVLTKKQGGQAGAGDYGLGAESAPPGINYSTFGYNPVDIGVNVEWLPPFTWTPPFYESYQ